MIGVVSERQINELMTSIAFNVQGLVDPAGEPLAPKTIMASELRSAAMIAMHIACGHTILSSAEELPMPEEQERRGIFVRRRRA